MATSAPIVQNFNGKDYTISPMTLLDIQTVNNIMRADFITAARISNQSNHDSTHRQEILDAAMRQAGRMSMFTLEGILYMSSFEGTALLFYQSVRKHHPQITLEDCFEIFFLNDDNKQLFDSIWGDLNMNKNPKVEAKKTNPPATEQTT